MSNSRIVGERRIGRRSQGFIHRFFRELTACRQCGDPARVFDPICPHCGAGNPVRIPVSASVVVTAIAAQLAIVALRIA